MAKSLSRASLTDRILEAIDGESHFDIMIEMTSILVTVAQATRDHIDEDQAQAWCQYILDHLGLQRRDANG